jgi:hypothetical protein
MALRMPRIDRRSLRRVYSRKTRTLYPKPTDVVIGATVEAGATIECPPAGLMHIAHAFAGAWFERFAN